MFSSRKFPLMGSLFGKKKRDDKHNAKYDPCADYDFKNFSQAHHDAVTTVTVISNNLSLSGSKDKTVVLFDFENGTVVERWKHEKDVTKTTYDPVSDTFLSCSRDCKINQWSRNNIIPTQVYNGHYMVINGIDMNTEGDRLCSGSRDNSVRIWDTSNAQCINSNSISRNLVTHLKWARNSHLIAQTSEDKEIRIWDGRTLSVNITFPKKQYIQTWCDWSEDCYYCVSGSNGFGGNGCEATLWDIRSHKPVYEYRGHNETCCCAIFVPSGICDKPCIMTSSNDCTIKVWDYLTTECLSTTAIPGSGPISCLAIFPDGSVCASTFNTGIQVYKLHQNGTLTKTAQY